MLLLHLQWDCVSLSSNYIIISSPRRISLVRTEPLIRLALDEPSGASAVLTNAGKCQKCQDAWPRNPDAPLSSEDRSIFSETPWSSSLSRMTLLIITQVLIVAAYVLIKSAFNQAHSGSCGTGQNITDRRHVRENRPLIGLCGNSLIWESSTVNRVKSRLSNLLIFRSMLFKELYYPQEHILNMSMWEKDKEEQK